MGQAAFVKSFEFTANATSGPEEVSGSGSYAFQTDSTGSGSITTYSMQLQGSLDGVGWVVLVTQSQTGANKLVWAVNKPVKYVRVRADIAGTDLMVTATVLAV